MTRAKQANESSETDPKESKHGEDLYQNAGGGDRSYAIDFKGGQNFGEGQVNHAGKTRQFDVRIFYDQQTKLFFWGYFEMYQDYSSKWAANQFTPFAVVYLTSDKLRIFNNTGFGNDLTISESSEHQDSIDQAQKTVVHFFEREPIPSSKWEFQHVHYLKEMPRDFLKQCFSAFNMPPAVEDVQRQGNQWKVTVRVQQNGNAAEIILGDSYNLISTKFIADPAAGSVGGCN